MPLRLHGPGDDVAAFCQVCVFPVDKNASQMYEMVIHQALKDAENASPEQRAAAKARADALYSSHPNVARPGVRLAPEESRL
jgi:hypothetical protein